MKKGGNIFGPSGAPLTININAADLAPVTCPGVLKKVRRLCESTVFMQAFELRVAPAIMTGAKEHTVVQVPVYICMVCKTIIRTMGEANPAVEAAARQSLKGAKI